MNPAMATVTDQTRGGQASHFNVCPPPDLTPTLRPPPDIDKPGLHPGTSPVTSFTAAHGLHSTGGLPPVSYQVSATTQSACAPTLAAPYSQSGCMATTSPTNVRAIITSLGQGDRLASILRSMVPQAAPPYIDLRDPALWQRIRTAEAQAKLRSSSVGGAVFHSTTDSAIIMDLPTSHAAFAATVFLPSPSPSIPIHPLMRRADGQVLRSHTKRQRKGHTCTTTAAPKLRFAVSLRSSGVTLTTAMVEARATALRAVLTRLYPSSAIPESEVTQLVTTAFDSADHVFDEEDALVWAEGYSFPAGIGQRDAAGIQDAGSLAAYTTSMQARIKATGRGLSIDSINAVVPQSDPDYEGLCKMVDGIPILTDEDFVPNLRPPPLRDKYVKLAPCVNKLMASLYDAGLIFIIPTTEAVQIAGIHFSQTHWTRKVGKKQGRPIGDASAKEGGGCALNSDRVKELGTARWGQINRPPHCHPIGGHGPPCEH